MVKLKYTVDNGRRIIVGLSYEETTEFELLSARTPIYGTPPADEERRWLELLNKHEHALKAKAA